MSLSKSNIYISSMSILGGDFSKHHGSHFSISLHACYFFLIGCQAQCIFIILGAKYFFKYIYIFLSSIWGYNKIILNHFGLLESCFKTCWANPERCSVKGKFSPTPEARCLQGLYEWTPVKPEAFQQGWWEPALSLASCKCQSLFHLFLSGGYFPASSHCALISIRGESAADFWSSLSE